MKSICVAMALFAVGYLVGEYRASERPPAYVFVTVDEDEASCTTDEECMEQCPPPADEPECDGGPQS